MERTERRANGRVAIDGQTSWRSEERGPDGAQARELNTRTAIELDADACRWGVAAPGGRGRFEPIATESREVRRFLNRVLGAMQRASRPTTVRPVPKPTPPPAKPLPPTAPVRCPLCGGEGWPDCELCDGAGHVTARQAARFLDPHAD